MSNKKNQLKENIIDLSHVTPIENKIAEEELREEEIEESLKEIYQDDNGKLVNVSKFDIKKRHGFVYNFIMFVFLIIIIAIGGKYFYLEYNKRIITSNEVELLIDGPKNIIAGEEVVYIVEYKNKSNINITDSEIHLRYPDNFIFLDVMPLASQKNNIWRIGNIGPYGSGRIEIKGRIIGPINYVADFIVEFFYKPQGSTMNIKKEMPLQTVVSDIGINCDFLTSDSILVGSDDYIALKCKGEKNDFIKNFRIAISGSDNFLVSGFEAGSSSAITVSPNVWDVSGFDKKEKEIRVKFSFKEKRAEIEEVLIKLLYSEHGSEYYVFLEKKIQFNIIKNELNLILISNGQKNNFNLDFGEKLNYTIAYTNKGEVNMDNVAIMAILKGEILDWSSLNDKNKGKIRGNSITWTKEEIPELSSIAPGFEGMIDFSINILPLKNIKIKSKDKSKYEIESYAQFNIGSSSTELVNTSENKSNIILVKVLSDLEFKESIRYFSEENIPVGSGPLPPRVGETTSLKVYWKLNNNLHELNNVKVETVLPDQVQWNAKNTTSAGSIFYEESSRKIIWEAGRMPFGINNITAEFSISVTPTENDIDKILILLSGSTVSAFDLEADGNILKTSKPKTTKLEDDEIAESDGRVVGK